VSPPSEGNGTVKRFGEKLRTLRLRQGYTTRQLADLLAVSHTHVIGIENGKRGTSTELVLRIADLFQVTTDQLMRDELDLDNEHSAN
jgi:transcriptional regulator with XRE-family HTH domain